MWQPNGAGVIGTPTFTSALEGHADVSRVRSTCATAFGLVSACSRLAGTVTPFVAGSGWEASPLGALLCYAASAIVCAGVLVLAVADTSRQPMPDELHALVPEPLGEGVPVVSE